MRASFLVLEKKEGLVKGGTQIALRRPERNPVNRVQKRRYFLVAWAFSVNGSLFCYPFIVKAMLVNGGKTRVERNGSRRCGGNEDLGRFGTENLS